MKSYFGVQSNWAPFFVLFGFECHKYNHCFLAWGHNRIDINFCVVICNRKSNWTWFESNSHSCRFSVMVFATDVGVLDKQMYSKDSLLYTV